MDPSPNSDTSPLRQRRSHLKSRGGCLHCKQRHIKCDEALTGCRNCQLRGVQCTYPSPRRGRRAMRQTQVVSPRSDSGSSGIMLSNARLKTFPPTIEGDLTLQMTQIELIHHFSTITYHTMDSSALGKWTWQHLAPKLAMKHQSLMFGILAVSATHLAKLRPGLADSYAKTALQFTVKAVSNFQESLAIGNLPEMGVLFQFSVLMSIRALTAPKVSGEFGMSDPSGEKPGWISLVRGVRAIVDSTNLETDNERSQKQNWDEKHVPSLNVLTGDAELDKQLEQLQSLYSDHVDETDPEEADRLEIYRQTVFVLQGCYHRVKNLHPCASRFVAICGFLTHAPNEFFSLLSRHDPVALIIMAYFCPLLRELDTWFWEGWPTHILESVETHLEPQWQPWLSWPQSEVAVM